MEKNSLRSTDYDICIIGGGINGVGIAREAALQGLKVCLLEQNDLASGTSSASSKLIHGGLRYLEHFEFGLVKKALAEREVLLNMAPHIIWPLSFVLPHQSHLRPAWLIRIGLFLYDNLAKRSILPSSRVLQFDESSPLQSHIQHGFEYADAWVDDARLVVLNALAASELGADIYNYTRCVNAKAVAGVWRVTLQATATELPQTITARMVINAAGPWVNNVFEQVLQQPIEHQIRLVKGSHIIVPKLHEQNKAYILQNADKRIVFVLPYEQDFSLIGTTDIEFKGELQQVSSSEAENRYLIESVNSYFKTQLQIQDIVSSYAGVRPLLSDAAEQAQKVTRDYKLALDNQGSAPLLSVYGGKITTYRKLAHEAMQLIADVFTIQLPRITSELSLPGGDFTCINALQGEIEGRYQWLPSQLLQRLLRSYGTRCFDILGDSQTLEALGMDFGHGLYQAEVDYLLDTEFAKTLDDILWRRSKLGLRLEVAQRNALADYINSC
ncbi:glycerol-3-phosphate dehydrogenase [Saccharobesus litoralis]|uniref:Glycerol-3-phosphate dehydrogenase n=1 Tax=Saccharobesus litoralis TaxID=2172099 RepID=A0A2S0VNZ4_9ALTE|nr:glycerol-3-phosphate dehydrogenase [Saccharobesus litoralis]AWB65936.1 glycerol-3-phosphate dehydrogenase [Saccharobesus litoralis]